MATGFRAMTLLAQARQASDAVGETLAELASALSETVGATGKEAKAAARAALERAVMVLARAFLTWRALRSILTPMNTVSIAISVLIRGDRDVALPPEGSDEFGRMPQALCDSQEKARHWKWRRKRNAASSRPLSG